MTTPSRASTLSALSANTFDLLVIGGGITGTGIARDAALRGLKVALVERDDFASGTSSRSSRLIHGGLRYLEHGYLRLVHESSTERRRLLELAPHLVGPLAFTWPVYRGARVPRWKLRAGLFLYDLLAAFRNVKRHRGLSRAGVSEIEPELRTNDLLGGAAYYDAATDDSRLTLANAIAARDAQAVVLNHIAVRKLIVENGTVRGAQAVDARTGTTVEISARVVVNATGPWSDRVRALEGDVQRAGVKGSKGAHISIAPGRVGNRGALTLLSPVDGRVFFILPSGERTIVGTTDTFTDEDPDDVRASEADVDYLLKSANHFFPRANLVKDDVEAAWAGLRPLVAGSAQGGEGSASREHAITIGAHGLVTISGGKLTTYRSMAAEVVDTVERRLGRKPTKSVTHHRLLPGEPMTPAGSDLPKLLQQLTHAIEHEMACTLGDLLIRRTHVAFETRDHGVSVASKVADALGPRLGWSGEQIGRELDAYRAEVARIFSVR